MTHAELKVGQRTWFDVRGEKVGTITRLFDVDGVKFASIRHEPTPGYVEEIPRVGMARIYPNMAIPSNDRPTF